MPVTTPRKATTESPTEKAPIIDLTPRRLADLMHSLVEATTMEDQEVAAVLAKCREALRTISYNRQAAEQMRRSRARVLRRRHQNHQGSQNHA